MHLHIQDRGRVEDDKMDDEDSEAGLAEKGGSARSRSKSPTLNRGVPMATTLTVA